MLFDKELYWAKRNMGFRGQDGDTIPPVLIEGSAKAKLIEVAGAPTYFTRFQRRAMMRRFKTDLKKGRVDLAELNKKRLEINNDRKKSGE